MPPQLGRRAFNPAEFADEPEALAAEDGMTIQVARHALINSINQFAPPGVSKIRLTAIAATGLFADVVTAMSRRDDVIAVVNRQLASAGLEVVRKARS